MANENLARPAIVILAPPDVADMEAELRDRVGDTRNTRVVCRSGNPCQAGRTCNLVNIAAARSVIVLAGEHGDAAVVKAVLAVKIARPRLLQRKRGGGVRRSRARRDDPLAHRGAVGTVELRRGHRPGDSPGVSPVGPLGRVPGAPRLRGRRVLLRRGAPSCVGHTYGEALLAFDRSSVIGRFTGDGAVELNPPPDTVFGAGDQVIAVAEDDETLAVQRVPGGRGPEPASRTGRPGPTRVLIVGWSSFGPEVVMELDEFLAPGSLIEVCVDPSLVDPDGLEETIGANTTLQVSLTERRTGGGRALAGGRTFDQVDRARLPRQAEHRRRRRADPADPAHPAQDLARRRRRRVRIIAQLLDQANVELANTTGVDDFIVSDALASLMLAQLSERAELQAGVRRPVRPRRARWSSSDPPTASYPTRRSRYEQIVAAGAAWGVSVLGWRIDATGEVVVNPPKSRQVHLASDDQVLIVGLRAD